jgi:ankyrin repeat protein
MGQNLSIPPEPVYSVPPSNGADFSSPEALIASAQTQDKLGRLPLHSACGNKNTSLEDILRIYAAYPEAILVGDIYGKLALHYACCGAASIEVINFLVKQNERALTVIDKERRLPLHYAHIYSSREVIRKIHNAYPDGHICDDMYGRRPLYYTGVKEIKNMNDDSPDFSPVRRF